MHIIHSERRLKWHEYFLTIANVVALRSTCLRRKYGAVIVDDTNHTIISTGYNGSPSGIDNCCDIGYCYRKQNNIPKGERYEKCLAIHAEQNALYRANLISGNSYTMYIFGVNTDTGEIANGQPCDICRKAIINSNISNVIFYKNKGELLELGQQDLITIEKEQVQRI